MDVTADELAGVVDLFGGLTRAELERALSEVAYRTDGQSLAAETVESALERSLETFSVVTYEHDDRTLYVSGPTAFPTTPAHAEDLPHILDLESRHVERDLLGKQASRRFEAAVEDALEAADDGRARWLVDVSYDVETWAPVDLGDERDRLDELLEEQ